MVPPRSQARYVILASYLFAIVFAALPLGPSLAWWRPELLALTVIYWVLVMPEQTSMLVIFVAGCMLDLLEGSALGQHAMGLMVISYLCVLSYQRVRNYRFWHQAFFVFVFIGLYKLVGNWVHGLRGSAAQSLEFLLPALISALIWPLVWKILERIRLHHHVS